MRLRRLLALSALFLILLLPGRVLACACCAEPGHHYTGEQELDDFAIGLLKEVRFLTADRIGPEPLGISVDSLGENDLEFVVDGSFKNRTLTLSIKSANGKEGSLSLSLPANLTELQVDTHERSANSASHMGPLIFKEWRFKSKIEKGTGFFKAGIDKNTEFYLILQGRGNVCNNAEDFTHWRLEVSGEKTDYAFWGRLRSRLETYRVTNVETDDVLNIRANPIVGDPKLSSVIGKIPADGTGIFAIDEAVRVGGSYWTPVVWKDKRGWVNSRFIVPEEPVDK